MADRDASRITIEFPDLDYDGDGAVDSSSGFTACVFEGPNWTGFEKPATETTATCDSLNGWGNIIRTFREGTVIDNGSFTIGVDWDITDTNGGKPYGAFQSRGTGDFTVNIPANVGETTGPVMTIPGTITNFTPRGTVLGTENEARWAADITIKIAGAISFAAAT